jgi:hypothetical protein
MIIQIGWEQIASGFKTETRLPIQPGEQLLQGPTRVAIGGRVKWKVGNSYGIQPGSRRRSADRILLLDIEEGILGRLDAEAAAAEGFPDVEDFIQAWKDTYGSYDPGQRVWVLRFERVPTPEEKAAMKRAEHEQHLRQMAARQREKLEAAGHDLEDWQPDGDLKLTCRCRRCQGTVSISVGEMSMVAYWPLMDGDVCLADYPEEMERAREEFDRMLGRAYAVLFEAAKNMKGRESRSQNDRPA